MKTKKIIPYLLLPGLLAACTNEELFETTDNTTVSKEVVEDLVLKMSFTSGASSRGQYAGATDGVFQNFYLEPAIGDGTMATGNTTDGELWLSDNTTLRGDMLGLCLTSGGSAITNIPFYIAGYGSTKGTGADAKEKVYTFANQTSGSSLYQLGLDATKYDTSDTDLYNTGDGSTSNAKTLIKASATAIKALEANEPLSDNVMDVRKAFLRSNTGVMTGNYVAYYPYNASFTEPTGIPVTELDAITVTGKAIADDVETAISNSNFYDKLFACSSSTVDVNGGNKTSELSLSPVTGAIVFKVYNTSSSASELIKLITVSATENSENTDFALNGTMSLGTTNTFVPESKTTSMVGVEFNAGAITAGTDAEHAKYAMLPCYPNLKGKSVTVRVYTNNGKMAEFVKTAVPETGKAVTYTIDMAKANYVDAERYVYSEESFKAEATTAGTLVMLDDVEVTDCTINQELTIKGGHTLTMKTSASTSSIEKAIKLEDTKLVIGDNTTVNAAITSNTEVVVDDDNFTPSAKITAKSLTINAGKSLTVTDAAISDKITNNGTLNINDATSKSVSANTIDNNGTMAVSTENLNVVNLNNNKNAGNTTLSVNKAIVTNLINAEGATVNWNEGEMKSGLVITNNGTFAVNNGDGINFNGATLNNNETGVLKLDGNTAKTRLNVNLGTVVNNGNIEVTSTTSNSATLAIQNVVSFTNNNRITDNGQVYGQNFVTNGEKAQFIRVVSSVADFISANQINAYTTIQTGKAFNSNNAGILAGLDKLNKDLILMHDMRIDCGNKTLEGKNISVEETVTLVTQNGSLKVENITIKEDKDLKIGNNSLIYVKGVIETLKGGTTSNPTYGDLIFLSEDPSTRPSVIATDIETNGANWTSYPVYGQTVE